MVWTKISLIDSKSFNMFLLIFVTIVSFATLLFWPFSAWIRQHYQHPLVLDRQQRRMRLGIRIVAALDLAFIAGWLIVMVSSGGNPLFDEGLDPTLRLIQILGWLGTLGTLFILFAVPKTWKAAGEWWLSHLGNVVIVLSALSFSWFLWHWHMLHFSLLY